MRTSAPALLPIFRSDLQGRLLAALFLRPDEEYSIADLAARLEAHVATVHREVERLGEAGIVRTRRIGRARLVGAGTDAPYLQELAALVLKVFGPVPLLRELLARLEGVEAAFVFGSWAERYDGVTGPPPGDVDVIIVGHPDRELAHRLATEAGRTLGTNVDIVIRSPEAWKGEDEGFISGVREGHLVPLHSESA
jgi:predicted nucleotidyltransferase